MRPKIGAWGCVVNNILSLIPLSWRIAAVSILLLSLGLVFAGGAWLGYAEGYTAATAKGEAALAAEKQDRASEDTARALAVAKAEKEAREKVEAATGRANELETQLGAAKAQHAKDRAILTRRIDYVSQLAASTCAGLPAEWVHDYNAALFGAGDIPLPGNAGSVVFADPLGRKQASVSWLSQGQPLVSPADLLAQARDYGAECQDAKRKVAGWQQTYKAWKGQKP